MATDKNRRAAERRRLQRQTERRRQQDARRKRVNIVISIVAVVAVIGGVIALLAATGSDGDTDAAANGPTGSGATAPTSNGASSSSADVPAYPCTWTPKAGTAVKKVSVPTSTTPPRTGTVQVAVRSTRGSMTFTLDRAKAPCAVASFLSLAQQRYFDASACHRLTTGPSLYVLQCGDPSGTGRGGPGYSFGDEVKGSERYTEGVLAMANSGPDTNGSQFFIVYKDSTLDPAYTVFGRVSKGLNVVTAVAAKGVTGGAADGAPAQPISLSSVQVAK